MSTHVRSRRQVLLSAAVLAAYPFVLHGADAPGRVKVGMIGTAHSHSAGKLEALRRLGDLFEVVGVVEPNERLRAVAEGKKEYQGIAWMTQEQLLNHPGLHAVLVQSAVENQAGGGLAVASAGFHLHLEKPGATKLEEFRAILDTAGKHRRSVQLGYMFRGNPAFQLAIRAAREGWLGEINEIHGVIGKVVGDGERKEQARFAGGTMFELGCHLIDAAVAVCGKPRKTQALIRRTRADTLADNTLAILEYERALATIRSCVMDVEGGARRQFYVAGEKGAATILPLEPPKLTLTLTQPRDKFNKGTNSVTLPPMPGRYDQLLADFARVIQGKMEDPYPAAHELAVFETVLQAGGM